MKKLLNILITLTILFSLAISVNAQEFKIELSEKHKAKIEKAKSGKEKLALYKKFYKKDSMRWVKSWDKKLKQQSDSLYTAMQERIRLKQERLNDSVRTKVEKIEGLPNKLLQKSDNQGLKEQGEKLQNGMQKNIPNLDIANGAENLKGKTGSLDQLKKTEELEKAETYTNELDGLEKLPKEQLNQNKAFQEMKEYGNKAQSLNEEVAGYKKELDHLKKGDLDKLEKGTKALEQKVMDRGEFRELQQQQALAKEMQTTPLKYQKEMEQLADQQRAKDLAKQKAKEKAMELLTKHGGAVKEAQKKLAKLKKKYSSVQNSNDLSTAVKRSSLKGKPFKERFIVGTNFQLLSHKPFAIDFSPVLGYRFNKKFSAGLGSTLQWSFGKDNAKVINAPRNAYGYKGFIDYQVTHSFFAYSEYTYSGEELVDPVSEDPKRNWKGELNIGVGKWMTFIPKIKANILFLYNLLPMEGKRFYEKPIEVRFGFQLVDLDFKKKKK
ncbi:hypothetical protein QQ008_00945 [Fulvivirgaceae bacterium BMA10]|uniref:Outer membrane protein beta-barrel domain-containing protein n=1 Tax=Splendidivirga corallicola TaxID=3051826 RepID=A0ABT8KGP9_9BACT|nr:hypothetical protein [Fulvivirgaceae bacterium BMA10]